MKFHSKNPYTLWQVTCFVMAPVSLINLNATCRFNQHLLPKEYYTSDYFARFEEHITKTKFSLLFIALTIVSKFHIVIL
jgi:hypothetical protein